MTHDFSNLDALIDRYPAKPESLIMVLQEIQREYHYLPCEALTRTATKLNLPLSKVFAVSTFYNAFSLKERGEHIVRVCVGTACHIRGAAQLQQQMEKLLDVHAGSTTPDMKFTLEVVGCVGACAMAPVVVVDGKYHGDVKVSGVKKLLKVNS
jgi:NADH-quinone oxidoreductase subunit E